MRIAVITEGVGEYKAFPKLYDQFQVRTGNTFLTPLKVNSPPDAAPAVIARECKSRLATAVALRADLAVVVLDREQQETCPGEIALEIERAISHICASSLVVKVVLKNRAFENWLIADLDALRAQPKRFKVTAGLVREVEPGKADNCGAHALLKKAALGSSYEKVQDSVRICSHLDVGRAASHSRSLRHLLHVIGDSTYGNQCRAAVAA